MRTGAGNGGVDGGDGVVTVGATATTTTITTAAVGAAAILPITTVNQNHRTKKVKHDTEVQHSVLWRNCTNTLT